MTENPQNVPYQPQPFRKGFGLLNVEKMVFSQFRNIIQSRTNGNWSIILRIRDSKIVNSLDKYSLRIKYFSSVEKREKHTCARWVQFYSKRRQPVKVNSIFIFLRNRWIRSCWIRWKSTTQQKSDGLEARSYQFCSTIMFTCLVDGMDHSWIHVNGIIF